MSNQISNYDGSRPEPPHNTDSGAVVMLQEELDEMTADRDRLRAEVATLRRQALDLASAVESFDSGECSRSRIVALALDLLGPGLPSAAQIPSAPSADVVTPRPADMWAIHWSPGCWDLHEDRHEAEAVARTGICDLVPLWMHEPPGETDVVTVPREEWTIAQILANAWSRHPLTCGERDKLVAEWDALRSGEAGKGDAT